ncbi:unnamed protein product, partial [Staurois parvus]
MWGDQRVNNVLCCVLHSVLCCVLHGRQTALYCSAVLSNTKQPVHADRGEICIVYIQT